MHLTCNEDIGSSILSGGTMKKVKDVPEANTPTSSWGRTLTKQELLDLLDRLEAKRKARKA